MSSLKEWVAQVRYPYTAGILVIIWLGTVAFIAVASALAIEVVVMVSAITTIIIALTGFSSRR